MTAVASSSKQTHRFLQPTVADSAPGQASHGQCDLHPSKQWHEAVLKIDAYSKSWSLKPQHDDDRGKIQETMSWEFDKFSFHEPLSANGTRSEQGDSLVILAHAADWRLNELKRATTYDAEGITEVARGLCSTIEELKRVRELNFPSCEAASFDPPGPRVDAAFGAGDPAQQLQWNFDDPSSVMAIDPALLGGDAINPAFSISNAHPWPELDIPIDPSLASAFAMDAAAMVAGSSAPGTLGVDDARASALASAQAAADLPADIPIGLPLSEGFKSELACPVTQSLKAALWMPTSGASSSGQREEFRARLEAAAGAQSAHAWSQSGQSSLAESILGNATSDKAAWSESEMDIDTSMP